MPKSKDGKKKHHHSEGGLALEELTNGAPNGTRPLRFIEAALFQWVNPKAWLAVLSGVATYAMRGEQVVLAQALALGTLFFVISMPTTALWTSIGAGTARLLHTPRARRWFNWSMAGLLIASLLPLLFDR